jgi:hypothetical protein
VRLAGGGDLVHRAAQQPASEHGIDHWRAERKGDRTVLEPGGLFKAAQMLAEFLDHRYKPLALQ